MRNVRALISYDGSAFFGWQRQDGFRSVQQSIEEALEVLVGDKVVVHGAGRTDTGVHALGQVAHFHLDTALDDDRLRHALNFHLTEGVLILRLETCAADFHARFDARRKRYAYLVATSRFRPVFARHLMHWTYEPLDLAGMRAAAWAALVGRHDFSAFANAGSTRRENVRELSRIRIVARRRYFVILMQGAGFLYNMARTLAGTLIDVGRGKIEAEHVAHILASCERSLAGPTAPAAGLYLVSVHYDEPVFRGSTVARAAFRAPSSPEAVRESGAEVRGGASP